MNIQLREDKKVLRMPKKPGETSWDSDEDEDLLSDHRLQDDMGAGGDVEIDENILDMSDAEIELMPPEVTSNSLSDSGGAGDALSDHGYVTEPVVDVVNTDEIMIDENGDTYQVVYTDGETEVEGKEVTIETEYDNDENGIDINDQYVVVDEDGNVLQIVQHVDDQSAESAETARDMEANTGESISAISSGSAVAMETNTEQDACMSVMEEDQPAFEPIYGSDDEEEEESRRSDRFTSERNDDVISANAPTKRHLIPDNLNISSEDREKIQRYMEPRKSVNRNENRRPELSSMNYTGTPIRPVAQPQRGRKILINPHFRPRQDSVARPVVPFVAWDNTGHPVQYQRPAMLQRSWQIVPQQIPNVVHPCVQMHPGRQQAMMHQNRHLNQRHMTPHPMAPRPQMHPQHNIPRFQQQVMGPPLRTAYQPQFPRPGPPGRPLIMSRYRPPGPQQTGPMQNHPRPMMGPPMSGPPPVLNFQGTPLQQQPPPQGPPHFRPMSGAPISGPRFQAPPNRMPSQMGPQPRGPFLIRQHGPGGATGRTVMVRPRGAIMSPSNGQPRFIMRHRAPGQMTRTDRTSSQRSNATPQVQTIQTIVGGSTGSSVVHRTFKRVSSVVTAAPPAKLIKLDKTPVASESDYDRKLQEQAALRARIQEQKELRRQQMAGQRFQEAENTLAETGLSIENLMKQQPQAIKIASTNRQNKANRVGVQTPAGHVAGPGLVSGHRHIQTRVQQPHLPLVGGQFRGQFRGVNAEGGHLVGLRLVHNVSSGHGVLGVGQVTPVQSSRTVISPGGGSQVRTTGVVHVANMAPHTTRERIVALAGSVGPTKCVAFVNTGRARVEFVHPGDAVKFYSRFNRKSLDRFVLQMTFS